MDNYNPKLLVSIYEKLRPKWERTSIQRAKFCIDLLGTGICVNEVTEKEIDYLCTTLEKRGVSDSTINRYMASLSKMLNYAFKRRSIYHLDRVPYFEWRKEPEGKIRYMTFQEEKEMIKILNDLKLDSYLEFFLFLTDTGMRFGEATKFKHENVEVAADSMSVFLESNITKNKTRRSVPLTTRAKAIICPLLKNTERGDIVFNFDYWDTNRKWKKLKKAMDLMHDEEFTMHCLRHTFITRLAQSGKVGLHLIGQIAGHKSYKMTLRYAHFVPNNFDGALTVLNQINDESSAI